MTQTASIPGRIKTLAGLAVLLVACQSGPEPVDLSVTTPLADEAKPAVTTKPADPAGVEAAAITSPSSIAKTEAVPEPVAAPAPPKPIATSSPPKSTGKRSSRPLEGQSRLYDRSNPMYAKLQQANQSLAGFPADRMGRVDWMEALRQGLIKPRADRYGKSQMQRLASEIIMKNTREMPWVRFPHAAHTEWLDCKNCHESIFKAKQGANRIDMNEIFKGRYCGVCHDRVAFSVFVCERCHSVTHTGSPEAWWTQ